MSHVLLTGVTGFLGKVVLADLLRRRAALGLDGVTVLIRNKKNKDGTVQAPARRFADTVATAQVFADLPSGWLERVTVVAGDLEQPGCGLSPDDRTRVLDTVTHVIHCAASIEFDLPIKDAAAANITSALGVLELARACPKLVSMVDTSTAYVTPWRDGPIPEKLAHLPRPAEELYASIQRGERAGRA